MYLSDNDIQRSVEKGEITLTPFEKERLQPVSYDILLGNSFEIVKDHSLSAVDPSKGIVPETEKVEIPDGEAFVLHPGKTVLGTSKDYFGSEKYLIQLSGKSSLARLGLVVHNTAGIVNPGHFLYITFELFNAGAVPIILRPGMAIAQITFSEISSALNRNYQDTGHFNGDNWSKNFIQPE